MSIQKRIRNHRARVLTQAALPLALAIILLSRSSEVQATEAWRTTKTQAALFKVPEPASTAPAPSFNAAPNAATPSPPLPRLRWAVNVGDKPQLRDDIVVTPLPTDRKLRLVVTLAMRNRDQFYVALKDINDPRSPTYRKYLTPETYKATYGPTDQDTQKVVAYLQKNGFSDISVSATNQLITAKGDSSKITSAFNVAMMQFTRNDQQFFGNDSPAQVPQSLAGIVSAVLGLQNISVKHTYNHQVPLANNDDGINLGHSPIALQKIYHTGSSPTAYATSVAVVGWNDQKQTPVKNQQVAVGGTEAAKITPDTRALAVGANAVASGDHGTAIGEDSYAAGPKDTALGAHAIVGADGSTAVGANSSIAKAATNAVAIGESATVTAASATAIGQGASATAAGAVALGQGSVANRANTVSVGASGHERQITNVATGTQASDAANTEQVTQALATAKTYADAGDRGTLNSAKAYADQKVGSDLRTLRNEVNDQFHSVNKRLDQVGAMGAAMSQMAFSTQGISTPNRLGVGVGGYGGRSALSVGYSRSLSPQANLTFGGAVSNGGETSAGVGFGLGW